jgi:hypothetical protein
MKRLATITLSAALLLALPAVASAAFPHIYSNGVMKAYGKEVRIIGWGNVTFSTRTIGEVECQSLFAEGLTNFSPTEPNEPPPAARGGVSVWPLYRCNAPGCVGQGGALTASISFNEYSARLVESAPGVIRDSIPATVALGCPSPTSYSGEIAPSFMGDGISASGPEELKLESGPGGLSMSGNLKLEGYGAEELLSAKTP